MHEPMPLPPPPDDEFDDSEEPTRLRILGMEADVYALGVDRRIDKVERIQADDLAKAHENIRVLAIAVDACTKASTRNTLEMAELRKEVRALLDVLTEQKQEQPRSAVKKRK